MLNNYIKIAFRKIFRHKGYTLINILGLSVGLTVSLLILLWIQDEMKMDRFHLDGNRIYRVLANLEDNGIIDTWQSTPYPLIKTLTSDYPEIEDAGAYDNTNKKQFKVDGREALADGIYADNGFFRILSFPFIKGKQSEIFNGPNQVVISESLAAKLFGKDWDGNTLNKIISINGKNDYKISGVFKNPPLQSSLEFDFVLSLDEEHKGVPIQNQWGDFDSNIIIKLKEKTSKEQVESKIAGAILNDNPEDDYGYLSLQAYHRKYLFGQFENGIEAGGRIEYVRLFGFAALFLLLIACINFMNLATARASKQAKEVGIRKTIGANKQSLVVQFMTEASIITVISIIVAILLSHFLLGSFHEISGKELIINLRDSNLWLTILGVAVFTAFLAGSYPAFFLSSFRITNVLKNNISNKFSGKNFRHSLVVVQFVISALLVIGALVVQSQVDYIKNKNLGLDKENILYFRTPPNAQDKSETYRSELLQIPGIEKITFTNTNPLDVGTLTGDPKWEGMLEGEGMLFNVIITDSSFLTTMNITLKEGNNFSALLASDSVGFLANETAIKAMNLNDPIGKNVEFWGVGGPIVGVVKDFHIGSLHNSIGPLLIGHSEFSRRLTMLRINPERSTEIIESVQQTFEKFSTGQPFRYDFLDERYNQMYRSEERVGSLSRWFAVIALFISCLGLLGLSSFVAEQKAKEISIRKVLGATVTNIVFLLSKDFLKLVTVALLIAFPAAWYFMTSWLQNFAFRIEFSWEFFATAAGIAFLITILTVSFQSAKAAIKSPVDNLSSN